MTLIEEKTAEVVVAARRLSWSSRGTERTDLKDLALANLRAAILLLDDAEYRAATGELDGGLSTGEVEVVCS